MKMVKIVYLNSRKARTYPIRYDDTENVRLCDKDCLGIEFVIPKDARMAGIEDTVVEE